VLHSGNRSLGIKIIFGYLLKEAEARRSQPKEIVRRDKLLDLGMIRAASHYEDLKPFKAL